MQRIALGLITGAIMLAPNVSSAQGTLACTVERVIDGDTFICEGGERVRLLLVNAPEMRDEPLGDLARSFLAALLPPGRSVELQTDVQERDRYGRILAHVYLPDGRWANQELARRGFAQTMVIQPNVQHVEEIRAAVAAARAEEAGLWAVEGFREEQVERPAAPERPDRPQRPRRSNCHPSYPDVCIPPPPPDLNCGDIPHRNFRVVGSDPHRFDGDNDGVGCERQEPHPLSSRGWSPSWSRRPLRPTAFRQSRAKYPRQGAQGQFVPAAGCPSER